MPDSDIDEEIEIDEDEEPMLAELCDVSDITFEMIPRKGKARNKVLLMVKGDRTMTLFRFYFALKDYVEKIEQELGILPEAEEQQ